MKISFHKRKEDVMKINKQLKKQLLGKKIVVYIQDPHRDYPLEFVFRLKEKHLMGIGIMIFANTPCQVFTTIKEKEIVDEVTGAYEEYEYEDYRDYRHDVDTIFPWSSIMKIEICQIQD